MGIYIANMRKPNDCIYCNMYNGEWYDEELGIEFDCMVKNDQADECPLIELDLVRCGECKHLEVINKAPIYAHCHKWDYDFELWQEDTRKSFCSYGERRADEHTD